MTNRLEKLEINRFPARNYKVGTVATLAEVPALLESCSPHFILLLALDASLLEDGLIRATARTLIAQGLAELNVWGADCSRVHDLFDAERDPNETTECSVMTTWHEDEPLSEAACYFDLCACPAADFEADCHDWVAVSVGNKNWEEEIRAALIKGFDDED